MNQLSDDRTMQVLWAAGTAAGTVMRFTPVELEQIIRGGEIYAYNLPILQATYDYRRKLEELLKTAMPATEPAAEVRQP